MSKFRSDMMQIISFARDLYCKGDKDLLSQWPTSRAACMKVLTEAGYKEPDTYYIRLNSIHPGLLSIIATHDQCKYCKNPGAVKYHYLNFFVTK